MGRRPVVSDVCLPHFYKMGFAGADGSKHKGRDQPARMAAAHLHHRHVRHPAVAGGLPGGQMAATAGKKRCNFKSGVAAGEEGSLSFFSRSFFETTPRSGRKLFPTRNETGFADARVRHGAAHSHRAEIPLWPVKVFSISIRFFPLASDGFFCVFCSFMQAEKILVLAAQIFWHNLPNGDES